MHINLNKSAVLTVVALILICFIAANICTDPISGFHFSNCRSDIQEEDTAENSLSAPSLPRAFFRSDETNLVSLKSESLALGYFRKTVMNMMVISVYLIYASQVKDKHIKRLIKLLI